MNKYLVLFMCFILSLMYVLYEDNSDVRDSFNYQESIYVFNDIDRDTNIISNPNTGDINIYVYFLLFFYSLIFLVILVKDIKKINRYRDIVLK